jgi:hypothetical protein
VNADIEQWFYRDGMLAINFLMLLHIAGIYKNVIRSPCGPVYVLDWIPMLASDRLTCYSHQLNKALNPARRSALPIDRGHPPTEQAPGPSKRPTQQVSSRCPSSIPTNIVEFVK